MLKKEKITRLKYFCLPIENKFVTLSSAIFVLGNDQMKVFFSSIL